MERGSSRNGGALPQPFMTKKVVALVPGYRPVTFIRPADWKTCEVIILPVVRIERTPHDALVEEYARMIRRRRPRGRVDGKRIPD